MPCRTASHEEGDITSISLMRFISEIQKVKQSCTVK